MNLFILALIGIECAITHCIKTNYMLDNLGNAIQPKKSPDTMEQDAVVSIIESKKIEAKVEKDDMLNELKKVNASKSENDLKSEDLPEEEKQIVEKLVAAKELETNSFEESALENVEAAKIAIADNTSKVGHEMNESEGKHAELIEAIVDAEETKVLSKEANKLNSAALEKTQKMERIKPVKDEVLKKPQ